MKQSARVFAVAVAAVAAVGMCAQPAWATRIRVHEMAESSSYKQKAPGMLGRGLLNGVTCFVDILVNTVNDTRTGPPLIGTLTGLAKGTGCGVLRLGSGVVDVGTFWVPGFNGFPVSDSYENCLGTPAGMASEPAYNYNTTAAPADIQPSEAYSSTQATPASTDSSGAQTEPAARKWSK